MCAGLYMTRAGQIAIATPSVTPPASQARLDLMKWRTNLSTSVLLHLERSLHPKSCMRITLEVVVPRLHRYDKIIRLSRQLKHLARGRKSSLDLVRIGKKVDVVHSHLECEANHITRVGFNLVWLEEIPCSIGDCFDNDRIARCCG